MIKVSHDYDTMIVQQDHPALRAISKVVPESMFGTSELFEIVKRMTDALEIEPDGVAIACPQIGENWRIFIVHRKAFAINDNDEYDTSLEARENLIVINPEITKMSKKMVTVPEGCLSVRWLFGKARRSKQVTIKYQDINGTVHQRGASNLMAQIFQHENDHLNGILFHDHSIDIQELSEKEINGVKKSAERLRKRINK